MKIYKCSKKINKNEVSRGQEQAQKQSYYVVPGKDVFKLSGFRVYLHVIPLPCPAYVGLKNCE